MKNKLALALFTITLFASVNSSTASAQPQLNRMRIGACLGEQANGSPRRKPEEGRAIFEDLVTLERKRGLVIDVRPFAINQASGKLSFSGKTGHVTVVNMNPFVYRYDISIAQQELMSSALSDFLDLLLPANLKPGGREQSGSVGLDVSKGPENEQLSAILARLNEMKCPNFNDPGCEALKTMRTLVDDIKKRLATPPAVSAPAAFEEYRLNFVRLTNVEADAYTSCIAAGTLRDHLAKFFDDKDALKKDKDALKELKEADTKIRSAEWVTQDLNELVEDYRTDATLKDYNARCVGFKCFNQVEAFVKLAATILTRLRNDVNSQLEIANRMKAHLEATNEMANKDGLFARTFDIIKRFEFSEATVSVLRTKLEDTKSETTARESGADGNTSGGPPKPLVKGGSATGGGEGKGGAKNDNAENKGKDPPAKENSDNGNGSGSGGKTLVGQSNQSIQIGRPRFLLSGGLVFSPMQRRTFKPVTGFTRDANGNPTGDGTDNVIGLGEDSPRRLLPMAVLNTRIHSFSPTSIFFSLGVTAKHDSNVDIEYLLGPTVSFLDERAFFTFGGYLGKVENLVPDLRLGDKIPASAGDAKLFTKRYSMKPGFSFTYIMSKNTRSSSLDEGGGGSGSSSKSSELKNEIRIGGIPFNMAMGLVYSSLEDQTYDEIVGFARDRQGNLTNGQTLTRVAGLTSDSGYRVIPMAMLHSRLLNFGSRSLYFTTGVSGRKVDDSVKIEYLLGASVNVYRRKLFFTFGAFAGKRQELGGDFFQGAALEKDQSVTTHDRYIWKPAFGFSYDISRVFRKDSQ